MRQRIVITALVLASIISVTPRMEAARVRVVHTRGHRVRVTVRPGFPIRRTLPEVVIRPGVAFRVAPRVYLAPVIFTAAVVASLPPAGSRAWSDSTVIEREDGWTEFTMNVDRRGSGLILQIDKGAAQVSFAEVVFENGDTQVVDFNDKTHARGVYSFLDFKDGRKVDHVRLVAKADTEVSEITMHLVS
jgi:hypothetical protein